MRKARKKIDSKFVVSRVGPIKSWVDVRSIVRRGDYAFFNFLEFILTDPVNTNKPLNGTPVPIDITVNWSTQQLKHPVYNDPIFVGKDKFDWAWDCCSNCMRVMPLEC